MAKRKYIYKNRTISRTRKGFMVETWFGPEYFRSLPAAKKRIDDLPRKWFKPW